MPVSTEDGPAKHTRKSEALNKNMGIPEVHAYFIEKTGLPWRPGIGTQRALPREEYIELVNQRKGHETAAMWGDRIKNTKISSNTCEGPQKQNVEDGGGISLIGRLVEMVVEDFNADNARNLN